ncbi:MAG: Cobalt/magnesium transport protein CorA [Planctomycetes bacterium]|nr:Cobalt/magnesium transport protein CorA [Planctomycetota bacterium]HRJ79701.1 magnesium/cobalt transporter CorA [Planctomycetota bacterium]
MSKKRRRARETEFRRRTAPGAAPGTVAVDPEAPRSVLTLMAFGPDRFEEGRIEQVQDLKAYCDQWPVVWVNVDGLGDAHVISQLGEMFHLHKLAMEDVVNVHQRAKVETYGDQVFIVGRMVELDHQRVGGDQLSMFVGPRFVLSFQERSGDCFDPVRDQIRKARGRVRQSGPDFLAYLLVDAVVDHYFPVLERFGEIIEELEDSVVENPERGLIGRIHEAKRDLLTLRRALWPLREAVHTLYRDPLPLFAEETRLHLRDTYDHTIQIIDLLETYRETSSSLIDVYLSSLSNRMNEIMKVLTIIATVFIPLGWVAGVYGMNFDPESSALNMPELKWAWGYPFALALMLLIVMAEVYFFWRKGWLKAMTPSGGYTKPSPSENGNSK